jgi:hypothetical protein
MLTDINPKLPMRDKALTKEFYIDKLGFQQFGNADYDGYLMVQKDNVQIHFFEFKELDPKENYGRFTYEQMILKTCTGRCSTKKYIYIRQVIYKSSPGGKKSFHCLTPTTTC